MPDANVSEAVPRLERCPRCASLLVQPLRWRRLHADRWELHFRCPDCDERWSDHAPTAAVRRLDDVLCAGRAVLERHLAAIERIERDETVAAFVAALDADAILPEDFGRPR